MIDLFRILKVEYKEYVILFKSGNFYISFDEDSTILNKIFDYKIVDLKNNIKTGFPLTNMDMVKEKFEELKINYIIVKNKSIDCIYENNGSCTKLMVYKVFNLWYGTQNIFIIIFKFILIKKGTSFIIKL